MEKSLKNVKARLLRLLVPVILIGSSCEEEKIDLPRNSSILQFASFDEVMSDAVAYSQLNTAEIAKAEDAKGFKSFGRMSDEVYAEARSMQNKSRRELEDFVAQNGNFVELTVADNGEVAFKKKLRSHPFRYLINRDRMLQIGSNLYQVAGSRTLETPVQDLAKLRESEGEFVSELGSSANLTSDLESARMLDTQSNCGTFITHVSTSGSRRVEIELQTYQSRELIFGDYYHLGQANFYVYPQEKVAGVWWSSTEMWISSKSKFKVDFNLNDGQGWKRSPEFQKSVSNFGPEVAWGFVVEVYEYSSGSSTWPDMHFAGYDVRATVRDTDESVPSVPTLAIYCNLSVF